MAITPNKEEELKTIEDVKAYLSTKPAIEQAAILNLVITGQAKNPIEACQKWQSFAGKDIPNEVTR